MNDEARDIVFILIEIGCRPSEVANLLPGQTKQLVCSPQQVLPGERPSTDHHVIYSFRHSFEDRMKEGDVDAELRKMLMGHTVDRPDYGEEGSLAWRRNSLPRIALPFDPAIV